MEKLFRKVLILVIVFSLFPVISASTQELEKPKIICDTLYQYAVGLLERREAFKKVKEEFKDSPHHYDQMQTLEEFFNRQFQIAIRRYALFGCGK